jgi:hypothetical protein
MRLEELGDEATDARRGAEVDESAIAAEFGGIENDNGDATDMALRSTAPPPASPDDEESDDGEAEAAAC